MEASMSWFHRKDPQTPVKGCRPRLKNIFNAMIHFKGLLGTLVPIILLSWQFEKGKHDITVRCIWILMFCMMLIKPIAVSASGFLPIVLLPICGVASTVTVAKHYFNDSICLYILGGMMHLLINTSGFERQVIMWLLCSGDCSQFSGKRLIFKASTAAFFMSIFTNRLITTSVLTQYLSSGLMNLQTSTSRSRKTEPDYDEMRFIILSAVQSASSIGSVTILHAALTPIAMKAIWTTDYGDNMEYADIFNYLQYTCFAFPVALFMIFFNVIYHILLFNLVIRKPMSGNSMKEMRTFLLKQKEYLAPVKLFYKETIFFYLLFLTACFFRWSDWLTMGWSSFRTVVPDIPMIKDATVAAIFVTLLSILPRNIPLWKYIIANKKSELGALKPESSMLWWKFVDKNTNYGYIILIGGAVALNAAIRSSGLGEKVTSSYGYFITSESWNPSIFIVCLISVFLANIMSGIAACCIFLPFVLNMALEGVSDVWKKRVFLGSLGVGIGTSMDFCYPFLYTPAYFCHYTGKVPHKKMMLYGLGSAIICLIILWLSLCFYAPIIWDPNDEGIKSYNIISKTATILPATSITIPTTTIPTTTIPTTTIPTTTIPTTTISTITIPSTAVPVTHGS